MAGDLGFFDLKWIRYVEHFAAERLGPLRAREEVLEREIRGLQGLIDAKRAEVRGLHLRAVLEGRNAGLTRAAITEAVDTERAERLRLVAVQVPPSLPTRQSPPKPSEPSKASVLASPGRYAVHPHSPEADRPTPIPAAPSRKSHTGFLGRFLRREDSAFPVPSENDSDE